MAKDYSALYAAVNAAAHNHYHKIYRELGLKQESSGNFHCPNPGGHADGRDDNASLSMNNETGVWKCHCCGIKGNITTMFKEYVAGTASDRWGGKLRKFFTEYFNLGHLDGESIDAATLEQLRNLDASKLVRPLDPTHNQDITYVTRERNDEFVNALLSSPNMMKYVMERRNWDEKLISKYRIGYSERDNAITFPMIDVMGRIPNLKLYRPWKKEGEPYKWQSYIKSNPILPTPIVHLSHNKIYIFEGEPDMYMAAVHGLYGITSGSAANKDYVKIFGEAFESTFKDKEIVIVCDSDKAGLVASQAMALQFLEVAKQVKIINLDKSDINPTGLDPELTHEFKGKQKRNEKDVTDFFRKNGFGESATKAFLAVEKATTAFTDNRDRTERQMFKVNLEESQHSKYFSRTGNIHLQLLANVADLDDGVYKFPTQVCVGCKPLRDITMKNNNMCKKCRLATVGGFGDGSKKDVVFDLIRVSDRKAMGEFEIEVSEKNILEMIQTTEKNRVASIKGFLGIPTRCEDAVIDETTQTSIQKVNLIKDPESVVEEDAESVSKRAVQEAKSTVVEAYFVGEVLAVDCIEINKCYRIKAVQTVSPAKQKMALFCYDVQPQRDSSERFVMTDEIAEMLKVFRPSPGQTIKQALEEKYKVFGGAAGINGREDVFMLCDLAFFSPIEMRFPQVLPSVSRGWVEVLVAGDTRCGKSIASEFLYNHYRIGEFVGGGKTITTTGMLGGITKSFDKSKISWGIYPQNDRGVVIMDELSCVSPKDFESLRDMRSSGIAEIEKIVRGKAAARVRKIFMSNWREDQEGDVNRHDYGINNIRKLCVFDASISRFDAALVVKATDVLDFDTHYDKISEKYTSYQCRNLIMWAHSRKPGQFKMEDGFSDALNRGQKALLDVFHPSSQLVNQEMRAKICRMAIAVATEQFSTDGNDYGTVLVKCEHADFITDMLMRIYGPGQNIGLYEYSQEIRRNEQLGGMKFMMSILKVVDIESVLAFKEGSTKDIMYMFSDYLLRVTRGEMFIVDGKSDRKTTSWKAYELGDKFIGLLLARNCIGKMRKNNQFRKTDAFAEWLRLRKEAGDAAEQSDILENNAADADFGGGFKPADLVNSQNHS